MNDISSINEKWIKKCKCELKKTATQAVCGSGNIQADIVFIGEAPGKQEDLTGIPFVGSAGKILSKLIESIKSTREDVYITNIVKYRPPENRDPNLKEKQDCYQWLIEELNLINPKLIVFLGRHALNNFFPNKKISEVHGILFKEKIEGINTQNFLSLYHPAATIYNRKLKSDLEKDFKKIPKLLKLLS